MLLLAGTARTAISALALLVSSCARDSIAPSGPPPSPAAGTLTLAIANQLLAPHQHQRER